MDELGLLRELTAAFAQDVAATPVDARPVALGRWTVADLAAHLGAVHRWAAQNARGTERASRQNVPAIEVPPAQYYAESRRILLDALDELDPDQRCYTFQPGYKIVRFWHRRQAHETLIHLWDLRSSVDPLAPPPPEAGAQAYADGIDELFSLFVARSGPAARVKLPGSLGLSATDVDRRWTIRQDADWTVRTDDPNPCDTEVSGTAGELMLLGWDRVALASGWFGVAGDPAVVETFLKARVRP